MMMKPTSTAFFILFVKEKAGLMPGEKTESHQLWRKRTGKTSLRRWYLSQDWRREEKWNGGWGHASQVKEAARTRILRQWHVPVLWVTADSKWCRKGRQGRDPEALGAVTPFFADADAKRRVVTIQTVFFTDLCGHWVPSGFEDGRRKAGRRQETQRWGHGRSPGEHGWWLDVARVVAVEMECAR